MALDKNKVLVVLSGGQDSTTCLYWAMKNFTKVEAIHFIYGQKHQIETDCATSLCKEHEVSLKTVDISFFGQMIDSALTRADKDVTEYRSDGLPNTFVPNRNQLFFTIAHAHAQMINAQGIVLGVCEADYSGYPDCRAAFIRKLSEVTNLGSNVGVITHFPLVDKTKGEIFALANSMGVLEHIITRTHTCYKGDHEHLHEWGYGCGICPACELRKKGYNEFVKYHL